MNVSSNVCQANTTTTSKKTIKLGLVSYEVMVVFSHFIFTIFVYKCVLKIMITRHITRFLTPRLLVDIDFDVRRIYFIQNVDDLISSMCIPPTVFTAASESTYKKKTSSATAAELLL